MDNISKRSELYKDAPENIKEIYAGEETGAILRNAANSLGITDKVAYRDFALTIGDVILGLYPKEHLGQMLQDRLHFTPEQTTVTLNGLNGLLKLIPETEISDTATPIVLPPATPEANTLAEAIKPIRTFTEDVNLSRAHGYGAFRSGDPQEKSTEEIYKSNQDNLLNN